MVSVLAGVFAHVVDSCGGCDGKAVAAGNAEAAAGNSCCCGMVGGKGQVLVRDIAKAAAVLPSSLEGGRKAVDSIVGSET